MNKNKVIVLVLVAVAAIGVAVLVLFASLRSSSESNDNVPAPNGAVNIPGSVPSSGEEENAPALGEQVLATQEPLFVTYTDTGFSPSVLRVKVGDAVVFTNASSGTMWPASASHPTHKVYPTTGGCLGSTFDACRGFEPGTSWTFRFDFAGTWGYHNHLHPSSTGTIIVE